MSRIVASSVLVTLSVVGLPRAGASPDVAAATLRGHKGTLSCLAFTRDGKTLASGGKDGTVTIWDVAARKPTAQIPGHKDMVVALAFSPDGKTLAATSHDSEVRLYDAATGKAAGTLVGHGQGVRGVAFSPDGK